MWEGRLWFAFTSRSGVRQGCPLSSVLFLLVTDCILRALQASMVKPGMLRGYADDLVILMNDFWKSIGTLALQFKFIASISNLCLNIAKCVLVPLWKYNRKHLKDLLTESVPFWSSLDVASYAKYLGVLLGPGAGKLSTEKALNRYSKKCSFISSMKQGLMASLVM